MRTVRDLIHALEEFDLDAPILVAHQPNWPLQETISTVMQADVECEFCGGENGHETECEADKNTPLVSKEVYVVLGGQVYDQPYAPRSLFDRY